MDDTQMRSLDDERRRRGMHPAACAAWLGIAEAAYERLLIRGGPPDAATQTAIAAHLGLATAPIAEFAPLPPPHPALIAQVRAALAEADQQGWYVCDPDSDVLLGRADRDGMPHTIKADRPR